MRFIAEIGSCHMGKLDRCLEAIDRCKEAGLDAVKFQLFPNEPPYVPTNIYLPPEMFLKAFEHGKKVGIDVSASVFDQRSYDFLHPLKPSFIKFAYSKKENLSWIASTIISKTEAIVSCDVMTDHLVPKEATKLYCIPEYPIRYEISFDGLFPRFDGFSDHTLGIRQTEKAVYTGARVIEKHVRLGYADEICPDARFAVLIEELGGLKDLTRENH